MKFLFNFSLIYVLLILKLKCDLPITCYEIDIIGNWTLDITDLKVYENFT